MEEQAHFSVWESQEDFPEEVVLDTRLEGYRSTFHVDIEWKNGRSREEHVQKQIVLRE